MDSSISKTITIGKNDIYYLDSGESNLPIIIMLSGWPVSCHIFKELINLLSPKFRCIAVDVPGWGNSTDNEKVFHNVDYNVEFVHEFSKMVIPDKTFSIFGYSTGGVIGAMYSAKNNNVNSLILFSSPLSGPEHMRDRFNRSHKTQALYYTVKCLPQLLSLLKLKTVKEFMADHVLAGFAYKGYSGKLSDSQNYVIKDIIQNSFNLSPKAIFDIAIDLKKHDYIPLLKDIKCKSLFLSTTKEWQVPTENTRRYANSCKNSRVQVFENFDHFLILENPKLIAEAIESFI